MLYRLDYSIRPVFLPERPDVPLWFVVFRAALVEYQ